MRMLILQWPRTCAWPKAERHLPVSLLPLMPWSALNCISSKCCSSRGCKFVHKGQCWIAKTWLKNGFTHRGGWQVQGRCGLLPNFLGNLLLVNLIHRITTVAYKLKRQKCKINQNQGCMHDFLQGMQTHRDHSSDIFSYKWITIPLSYRSWRHLGWILVLWDSK